MTGISRQTARGKCRGSRCLRPCELREHQAAACAEVDRRHLVVVLCGVTGALLDAVAGDRFYALWHLITFRGLRGGEACGLRWADTDLDRGVMSIQAHLVQIG